MANVDTIKCGGCGFVFDAACGKYGCPDCHGEGLQKFEKAAKNSTALIFSARGGKLWQ